MEQRKIKLSDNESLIILIGDGVTTISKFINMWYEIDTQQFSYMEHEDIENAEKYIDEALKHYFTAHEIQCCNCGKWIKIEDAIWMAPAACSCKDCETEVRYSEEKFLEMLD